MERVTNYEVMASAAADIFEQNAPTGPYQLYVMVATLISVWLIRHHLNCILVSPLVAVPFTLTPGTIDEINRYDHIYSREFLDSLTVGGSNPFTPEVLEYIRQEIVYGDEILVDAGLDIIAGPEPYDIQELIYQVVLLYV